MKTILIEKRDRVIEREGHNNPVGVWPTLAFMCLGLGIMAPVLGLIFIIVHAVVENDAAFGEVGTVLMILSIPLLLAGSHFLDMWDKHTKK